MEYVTTLTVPASTPLVTPTRATVRPLQRFLKSVEVSFPPGVMNTTYIRVMERGRQLAPQTGWITGEGRSYLLGINKRLEDAPILAVEGYNLASDYEHTISFIFFMED